MSLVYGSKPPWLRGIKQTVRIAKSEAEVTNNKRLCSRYCTVEDKQEAVRGLSATVLVNEETVGGRQRVTTEGEWVPRVG